MRRERSFGLGSGRPSDLPPGPSPRTALPVRQGCPQHLDDHLHRLAAGATALGQPAPWVLSEGPRISAWLIEVCAEEDAALRLQLWTGGGLITARLEPLPSPPDPCRLLDLLHPLDARRGDPLITHKGLAGDWSDDILAQARRSGADDALLLWSDGTLAETAIAAVGVELGDMLVLPPPAGRVASLAEQVDLPAWAEQRGLRLARSALTSTQARQGRLWCLNALRGIWPATLL